ncbi:flagellar basal body-associated FliL family protein [Citrobacter sp. 50677481]|uniref:flagellar basal body-associated FliL family protein n=1 Tax=Citrobacter sp. 50677481 TaxID=1736699 RepID=UPI000741AA34|nr:flagellar basal body-associated FliL family protein [Citrobacter sp. 50677481]KSY25899.1 flagellar biogenesis protein [Citrobacter sp. 50677481]HCQ7756858.1 flagellar basal body-associated FliL family protein [Citrobacter sedlakii]
MNTKTLLFGVIIALVTAVMAAGLTVVGTHLLRSDERATAIDKLFSSSGSHSVEFVEIKNLVITLKGSGRTERYLLLELNLATNGPDNTRKSEEMIPAIRGATVSLLSDMEYSAVRALSVGELHNKLKTAYEARFSSLNMNVPFDDVIISKMVFQ